MKGYQVLFEAAERQGLFEKWRTRLMVKTTREPAPTWAE